MDAWTIELERLTLHRSIIQGKLALPSNPETRDSLQKQLDRVNYFLRRHQGTAFRAEPDPWRTESRLKKCRSRTRQGLREARLWGNDDRVEYLRSRIERQTERIREAREDQEAEEDPGLAAVFKRLRKPPTAAQAQKGIEVVLRIRRESLERARARGDAAAEQDIAAHIGRLESMIAALPGVPA
jgi:hypothetical protein